MSSAGFFRSMMPYGMEKNSDGTWTFFNRDYKPLGVVSDDWRDWDDPNHKIFLKGLGPATLKKLDVDSGEGSRIYFYEDGSNPTYSKSNREAYLEKIKVLMSLETK